MTMRREVENVEQLRAIVGEPDQYVANKVKDQLSAVQRQWLENSPLCFLATTDAQGRVDVSPKGDPAGFVHIIDDTTIAIPDRRGNKRVDGYLNLLQNPQVGTVFVIPGRGDTLRINGTARILADADYFDALVVAGYARRWRWRSPSKRCSSTAPGLFCGPMCGTRRPGRPMRCPAPRGSPRPSGTTGARNNSTSTTARRTSGRRCTRRLFDQHRAIRIRRSTQHRRPP